MCAQENYFIIHDVELLNVGIVCQVYLSARSWPAEELTSKPFGDERNIYRVPGFEGLSADGSVKFSDGRTVPCVDTVLFATGYKYDFPFLRDAAAVSVDDNRYGLSLQYPFLH